MASGIGRYESDDHDFQLLYGLEPVATRSSDHDRYLELSRAVTGEVMAGGPARLAVIRLSEG